MILSWRYQALREPRFAIQVASVHREEYKNICLIKKRAFVKENGILIGPPMTIINKTTNSCVWWELFHDGLYLWNGVLALHSCIAQIWKKQRCFRERHDFSFGTILSYKQTTHLLNLTKCSPWCNLSSMGVVVWICIFITYNWLAS